MTEKKNSSNLKLSEESDYSSNNEGGELNHSSNNIRLHKNYQNNDSPYLFSRGLHISGDEDMMDNLVKIPSKISLLSAEKNDSKKTTDVVSTEKETSKKKKNSLFNSVEKMKGRGNSSSKRLNQVKRELNPPENTRPKRKDRYGVTIDKKNKRKVRVTFTDQVDNEPFEKVILIESFKKYNYLLGMPKEENVNSNKSTCECCNII